MNLWDGIPHEGLFPNYLRRASRLTGAPGVYHVGCTLATLSAVVGPNSIVVVPADDGERKEHIHLWVLLIGKTSSYKTYSTELAVEAVEDILGDRTFDPTGSQEGIKDLLLREPNPLIHVPEAPSWFSYNRAPFVRDGAAMWCSIYDGFLRERHLASRTAAEQKPAPKRGRGSPKKPDEETCTVETKRSSKRRVSVGLLAAGQTGKVISSTRQGDWSGGLLARMMLVGGVVKDDSKKGLSWSEEDLASISADYTRIETMSVANPRIIADDEAASIYWEYRASLKAANESLRELHSDLCRRLDHNVLRVAGLFALSRFGTSVTGADMRAACVFGEHCRSSALSLSLDACRP